MPVDRYEDSKVECDQKDTLEYKIGQLSNEFVTTDKLCITERASIIARLYSKICEYKSQLEIYQMMDNMDAATAKQYAEVNSMVDFFVQLHEDFGELDNKRLQNCETLVNMLRKSNVYKYMSPEVQEYEY